MMWVSVIQQSVYLKLPLIFKGPIQGGVQVLVEHSKLLLFRARIDIHLLEGGVPPKGPISRVGVEPIWGGLARSASTQLQFRRHRLVAKQSALRSQISTR